MLPSPPTPTHARTHLLGAPLGSRSTLWRLPPPADERAQASCSLRSAGAPPAAQASTELRRTAVPPLLCMLRLTADPPQTPGPPHCGATSARNARAASSATACRSNVCHSSVTTPMFPSLLPIAVMVSIKVPPTRSCDEFQLPPRTGLN